MNIFEGYADEDIAKLCRVVPTTVLKWRTGEARPPAAVEILLRICRDRAVRNMAMLVAMDVPLRTRTREYPRPRK